MALLNWIECQLFAWLVGTNEYADEHILMQKKDSIIVLPRSI